MAYKRRGIVGGFLSLLLLASAAVIIILSTPGMVSSLSSTSGGSSNLTVWDATDPAGGGNAADADFNMFFYANYSNVTSGKPVNSTFSPDAGCNISIQNYSGGSWAWSGWKQMSYNSTSKLYEYDETLRWKNTSVFFNVTCQGTNFDYLYVVDEFDIDNSAPNIEPNPLPSITCYEDSCGSYDLSKNSSDPDQNDVLTYGYSIFGNPPFSCFSIDNTTGIIDLTGCTSSTDAIELYNMTLTVKDNEGLPFSVLQKYTIIAVNDAPIIDISGCPATATEDQDYTCDISANDEEDGPDTGGNLTFWTNTTWFSINMTNGNVSFNPDNSKVGNHSINISVNDSTGRLDSAVLYLEVQDSNDPPSLVFACYDPSLQTSKNATEDSNLTCWLNATDIDFGERIRFSSNESWFRINGTEVASYDGNGNFSLLVNFTPRDADVGVHRITIIANDTRSSTDSRPVNVTIFDVPDTPIFLNLNTSTVITGYENALINFTIMAWDNDTYWNASETITFSHNRTDLFNLTVISNMTAMINFTPNNTVEGEYIIGINITDGMGNLNFTSFNLTIFNNSAPRAPNISLTCYDSNTTFSVPCFYNLSQNVSELDGDSVTYKDFTYFFNISNTTGVINFTANDTMVGYHEMKIRLMDDKLAKNYTYLLLDVLNVSDPPVITNTLLVCYESRRCYRELRLNVTDEDDFIPGFNETLNYSLVNSTVDISFILYNQTTGVINFTPNFTQSNMTYMLNFTVVDSSGRSDSEMLNFTIFLIDDPPVITYIHTNRTAFENLTHRFWINASDVDSENLTFTSNTSWFLNATIVTGGPGGFFLEFNLTPNDYQVGNHTIQINVSDRTTNVTEIINFTVMNYNVAPNITWWQWKLFDSMGAELNSSTNLTRLWATENMTLEIEQITVDFDALDTLSYSWVIDGQANSTDANLTYRIPPVGNNRSINVTLIAHDGTEADSVTWNLTIDNINIPPRLVKNVTMKTWPRNTNYNLNISEYLWEPDGDNLMFTYNLSDECAASGCMGVAFSGSVNSYRATFSPSQDWYGIANITITANDSVFNVSTNEFTLNVTFVPPTVEVVYVQTTRSSGATRTGEAKASMNLQIERIVTLKKNILYEAPIIVSNTGEVDLTGVWLSAQVDSEDVVLTLMETEFNELVVDENATTSLRISLRNVTQDRYAINVTARSREPKLNQTSIIYVEPIPTNRTQVEVTIKFAKDLFEDNPECLELMEMIFQAEEHLESGNVVQARNLTNLAIEHCRDIIEYGQPTGRFGPSDSNLILNLTPIEVAEVVGFILAVWILANWLMKRTSRKKKPVPQLPVKKDVPPASPPTNP